MKRNNPLFNENDDPIDALAIMGVKSFLDYIGEF
jgi:hypothetical protein|tara:strand:- start:379 stop:480 length:102 start_codon:yes stop_codon:yes gene_type:complete